jgi:NDP-sugar pyrophosphorylase family protein
MDRERISITLQRELIKKLDQAVDGTNIRNRSHAIEFYLSKTLMPRVSKAVILAGGPGTSMRPFTSEIPKGLIPIHGRPLLEYSLALLKKYHIQEVVLSVGHLGEQIQQHFGNGDKFGMQITYVHRDGYVGTAGALAAARPFVTNGPFVVMHGDILIDIDLDDMINFHEEHDYLVSMGLTSVNDPSDFGAVQVKRNTVVAFEEKPSIHTPRSHVVNTGVYVMGTDIYKYFPPEAISSSYPGCSLEKDIFPKLIQQKKLGAYIFAGPWFDIGTPESYERVLREWRQG